MPPKKTTKKTTEVVEVVAAPPVKETVVVKQAAAPVKETAVVKEVAAPKKQTKVVEVKGGTKEQQQEIIKEIEEEQKPKGPSKIKKCIKCVVKTFIAMVGTIMLVIGLIGFVQMFTGVTLAIMKEYPNKLISRILTNICLFGLIVFSGLCNIPLFSKYFNFTKTMFGFSVFLVFLGFSIQAGNLDNLPDAPTTNATGQVPTGSSIASTGFGETEKLINVAFGYVRGICGIVLLIIGIIGMIWGICKKDDDDEEEEEEVEQEVIITTK